MSGEEKNKPRERIPVLDLCRICLTHGASMETLHDRFDKKLSISNLEALEKVMCCKVSTGGNVPKCVCSMCLSILRLSYDLRIIFEGTEKKLADENIAEPDKPQPKGEVELLIMYIRASDFEHYQLIGNKKYGLSDILIVEEEEKEDYSEILQNLSENVTLELKKPVKNTSAQPDNEEEFETIIVEAADEHDENSDWEHRYAKKERIPKKLMRKIESYIVEGGGSVQGATEENGTRRRCKRAPPDELDEIEKYMIVGDVNTADTTTVSNEDIQKVMSDGLFQEAMSSRNVCHICEGRFATRNGLVRHLYLKHCENDPKTAEKIEKQNIKKRNQYPLLCQKCGFVSKSHGGARYHMLTHGERTYSCDICQLKFYTPSKVKSHKENKHNGAKKPLRLCPFCGVYKNSESALIYHIKLHTQEPRAFECSICGTKFRNQSGLTMHILRHKGERKFPCNLCDKSFFSTFERKKHVMTHTGERPHQCKYCDKKFITPFNRKVHMTTHDGPYSCEYCHRGFIDADVLNFHLRSKHKKVIKKEGNQQKMDDNEINMETPTMLEEFELLNQEEEFSVLEDE